MYVLIENGNLIRVAAKLPLNYRQISNFPALKVFEQVEQGWYEATITKHPLDGTTQFYGEPIVAFFGAIVTLVYPIEQLPVEDCVRNLGYAVSQYLDETAKERDYSSIDTCKGNASNSHTKYGPEGIACETLYNGVWDKYYQILGEVEAGTRSMPTKAELLDELPAIQWESPAILSNTVGLFTGSK